MQLTTSGYLEGLCGIGFFYTQGNICIQLTEQSVTEMTACNVFTFLTCERTVVYTDVYAKSRIFWKGMGAGLSTEQRVSPIWMSAMPEIATMEPMPASWISTLFNPSNS